MLKKFAMLLCLAAGMGTSTASAATVYGTSADLTGSRTQANFVLGGNYIGDTVSVSWSINPVGDSSWHYMYTFTGFGQPNISHIILDLTDDAVLPLSRSGGPADPNAVTNAMTNADNGGLEFGSFGQAPSNPGFPAGASIVGVKFEYSGSSPLTIAFDSNRAPVWGDFYHKGGSDSFAYNAGLPNHDSMNVLDFIARPNGMGVVPEPASLVSSAIGLGLLGTVGWLRSGRRKRSA